ncbi:MAG TPA: hypothetical protein ENK32_11225 [Anaerolineae bacterium]|nr:hypothetical protein [Anaerolineae bacterium]
MTKEVPQTSPLGGLSSQTLLRQARRLAAYLPQRLTRQILNGDLPETGLPGWLNAAVMFADVSGFTRITEELAADGPRGAEELNRTLLITFTALINAVHDAGGVISHFYGDAMMIYFPDADGRAADRALAAARFMQGLMLTSFARVTMHRTGQQKMTFALTIKIGLAYGRTLEMVVGSPESSMEFVLAGTAVDEAVRAQEQAAAGQVVAAQSILAAAGRPSAQPYEIIDDVLPVPPAQPGIYWEAYEPADLQRLTAVAPAFIPPALVKRLQNPGVQSVGEHRTVTSIFVQFTGIDFDDETAGSRMQVYYQWACGVVQRYGGANGRVNRILTGDKGSQLHILFGAPVAPDTPAQAIRCALALQAEKPRFITAQRIGLTAGRAFAGAVGSQNRREYTAVGALINLSARLTRHCPDGAIVLDENSAMRVWNEIELDSLPPIQVKGHAQPVTIYRVAGERARPIQMQTRFAQWSRSPLGREKEQTILEKALGQALRGKGGITVIYGPFGGGQTPLLAAGVRYWLAHGGRGLAGVSQLHTSDTLFAPWQAIWRDLFDLTPDMTPEAALEQVLSLAAEFCPDCGDDIQLWREPLNLPAYTGRLRPMPARALRLRFFHLALQTLAAAAARQPLLVVLEDVQWADQSSLDLLYYLADSVADLPIMLLATYHQSPGFVFRALNHAQGTAVFLDNLPPERARETARERLGLAELPLLLEQRLGLRDRQGQPSPVNPLFLEESLKMLLVSGALLLDEDAQGHGRVRVDEAKLLRLPIPDTVYAIMLARLDQLSPAAHALLQVAAVVGREFDLSTLLAVAPDVTGETAVPLLDELAAADMLHLAAQEPTPVYMFQHSVLHDAVYQSMPYARRQAIHTAVAELVLSRHGDNLKPWYPLLAYHYGQTDQHEAGLRYALLAADDARAVFANKGAEALYRQALVHLEALGLELHWQTAVRIYAARAETLHLLGLLDQAARSAEQALKLAQARGAPFRAWPLLNLLADIRLAQGRYTAVWSLTEQVVREGKRYDLARAYYLRGLTAVRQMDGARAAENLAQAAELAERMGERALQMGILTAQAGEDSESGQEQIELGERAVALAREGEMALELAQALVGQSVVLLQMGRPDEALAAADEAASLLNGISPNLLAHALTQRAAVYIYQGQAEAAAADLQLAADLLEGMEDAPGLAAVYLLWGYEYGRIAPDSAASRRRLERARRLLEEYLEEDGLTPAWIRLYLGLSQAELGEGRPDEARLWLAKAVALAREDEAVWLRPSVWYLWGETALAAGDRRYARELFSEALTAVHEGGCPDELPLILLQLARLTAKRDAHRLRFFETAVSAAHERSRYPDKVVVFREAGEVLAGVEGDGRLRRIGVGCLAWVAEREIRD